MQAKSKSQLKKRGKSSLLDASSRVSSTEAPPSAVFQVDFPQYCAEYGASYNPEIMMKDLATGKLMAARSSIDADRKGRRSRPPSISAVPVSTSSLNTGADPSVFSASPSPDGRPDASATPPYPTANHIFLSFEDEKKRENLKSVTFRGFPLEEAHVKALGKFLPQCPTLTTLEFRHSYLREERVQQLGDALKAADNLVEINFYENPVKEQNFHLILRGCKQLEVLFLRGCKVNDNGAKLLSEELSLKADGTTVPLLYLNLGTNLIEDDGALSLAKALRTNRVLTCLTLSGNFIADDGAMALADALTKFALTEEEAAHRRGLVKQRIQTYQRLKEEAKKVRSPEGSLSPRPSERSRSLKGSITSEAKSSKTGSKVSTNSVQDIWKQVDEEAGFQNHPLMQEVWPEDGKMWCAGNLHIAHLNLSFNRINILGAQKFLQALCYQMNFKTNLGQLAPSGLVNLVLFGNPIPSNWTEWTAMQDMLGQISGKPIAQRYAQLDNRRESMDSQGKPRDSKA